MIRFYNSPVRKALLLTLALSLAGVLLAALMVPALDASPERIRSNAVLIQPIEQPSHAPSYLVWGIWQRFDTLWYRHVAVHGYDREASVVFYPLYPLAIRAVHSIGVPTEIAAILVARLATFFLLWGLLLLLPLDMDPASVRRSLALMLLWPMSFILLAGYAEPFLMAATVWSLWFARSRRWWLAALCCVLACLSRAVGMVALAPLAWLLWQEKQWKPGPAALALAGPALFPLWLKLNGLPMASEVYPRYWHTTMAPPWVTLLDAFRNTTADNSWFVAMNVLAIIFAFAIALWKPVRREYFWYALGTLCFILTANARPPLHSFVRYVLPVFPVFAAAGCRIQAPLAVVSLWSVLVLLNGLLLYAFWDWFFLV